MEANVKNQLIKSIETIKKKARVLLSQDKCDKRKMS